MIAQVSINSEQRMPPLESGDRLSRPEFERRYTAARHVKKAELIEGLVYVASPLRFQQHAEPHSNFMVWLGLYQALTPRVRLGDAPTVRLDMDNEPQPDAVLLIETSAGGQTRLSQDDYIEGAPELVIEVAASSVAIDLGSKKQVYRRSGVLEYIIWQTHDNQLQWYVLVDGEYILLQPDKSGVIHSQIFPGLWLSVQDLLGGNMVRVLEVVQQGIQSSEHQAFVQRLLAQSS
jgi:Uma2 family endonuclease